jgi:hypothetical protein
MQELAKMGSSAARQGMGPAAWLSAACALPQGSARIERRALDGRRAALVEAHGSEGIASHVLLADAGAAWQDIAVFEGRIEAMEWQGKDLLLALPAADAVRVFSVFPGMRLRDAAGPGGASAGGLRWLRVSTRRSRR